MCLQIIWHLFEAMKKKNTHISHKCIHSVRFCAIKAENASNCKTWTKFVRNILLNKIGGMNQSSFASTQFNGYMRVRKKNNTTRNTKTSWISIDDTYPFN